MNINNNSSNNNNNNEDNNKIYSNKLILRIKTIIIKIIVELFDKMILYIPLSMYECANRGHDLTQTIFSLNNACTMEMQSTESTLIEIRLSNNY